MKINDKVPMNGYLSIYKKFSDGSTECVLDNDPNTITLSSRRIHLQYLFDYENAPKDQLSFFKIGTGGAVGNDSQGNNNVLVITPDPTRNDLYKPIKGIMHDEVRMTPSSPSDDTQVYLKIEFTLSQDEANGMKINECGLFKESGNMFNHKTFANIEKSESFSLIFDWKLRYV